MAGTTDREYRLPLSYQHWGDEVRERVLEWFEHEGREFPWRSLEAAEEQREGEAIHDPYLILVSEVMLQQTQTARVVEKLPAFLEKFPTVHALADAPKGELIRAWQGMGYNNRALRLQEAVTVIVEKYDGNFPSGLAELEALPGIGRYTASALACFAFGQHVPVIDVNVIRVLSRIFYKCYSVNQVMEERTIRPVAEAIIPEGRAYAWHQALMDMGATICTARSPGCERCPVNVQCLSAYPPDVAYYGESKAHRKPEPSLRGIPRRLWRGRIVELLRNEHEGMQVAEIIDRVLSGDLFSEPQPQERNAIVAMINQLMKDGLVTGAKSEKGGLTETDRERLPE